MEKARQLKNATITHVSYVDKAANKTTFFLTKSANGASKFKKDVRIVTKSDDTEQLVYGVVYEPGVEDTHGDFMASVDIEKAAHQFMKDAQNIDLQHNFVDGAGDVVESYIAPADFTVGDHTITKGSWVLVTKATDEVWDQIQKGELTGYSMAGEAEVVEGVDVYKNSNAGLLTKFKDFAKSVLGVEMIAKGEVIDEFNENRKYREFWDAYWIFDGIFTDELWSSDEPDVERIAAAAVDFGELLRMIASQPDLAVGIMKNADERAKARFKKEENDMTPDQMRALLKEELAPVNDRLASLEKSAEGEVVPEADAVPAVDPTEEVVKSLREVLKAELAPLNARLDTVEKARGVLKASNVDQPAPTTEPVAKSDGEIFAGLFTGKN